MPNWCTTKMTITGDAQELKKFLDGIAKTDDGEYSILDTYYPCPEVLCNTVSGWFSDPVEAEKHIAQEAENIANYGYANWYDWRVAKWGTKWGDRESRLMMYTTNEAEFRLISAWTPITIGMMEVSTQFPSLYFVMEHDEEAGDYMGCEVIKDGNILCESFCAPCNEYDKDFYDESAEDPWEEYMNWQETRMAQLRDMMHMELRFKGHPF